MNFFIPNLKNFKTLQSYTIQCIAKIAEAYGHTIIDNSIDADILLISLNDIYCIYDLEKIRIRYTNSLIVAGGHASVHFKLLSVFSDIVWVGHCFEFFQCTSVKEILNHKSSYTKDNPDKIIKSSQFIDWKLVPLIKVSNGGLFYWAGVGCKNKCSFCLTSWTNKHQKNTLANIKRACKTACYSKYNINLISNEYAENYNFGFTFKSHVKDMMIKDVDNLTRKDVRLIRAGIEFCTLENRKKYGKFFIDEQLFKLIDKANRLKIELNLFCLLGIESKDQWINLFKNLREYKEITPRVIFKFTTLELLQHTPLYNKRFELLPKIIDNYFTKKDLDMIHSNYMSIASMKYRTIPQASIKMMLYRVMLSLVTCKKEFEIVRKYKDYLRQDQQEMIKNTYIFLETDYQNQLIINHKS